MATACGCKTCMHIEFIVYAIIFHYSFLLFLETLVAASVGFIHTTLANILVRIFGFAFDLKWFHSR